MKALVKKQPTEGIWLEDVPIPTIGPKEVLVKVRKTSICGTDVHIYKWDAWAQKNVPVPLVIGHEFVGDVVEIGKDVKNVKVGQRVSAEGHLTCGYCKACLMGKKHLCFNVRGLGYHTPGCFAEYVKLPEENIFILPETITDSLAAIFDPFGNAVHATLMFDLTGEDVLITGAGPIGIMAAAIAQKAGAHKVFITDINPYRLDLARKMSASTVVNIAKESLPEKMKENGVVDGFTVGIEMSGHPDGLNMLLQSMQYGGRVSLMGILPPKTDIDWDLVIFRMLTLKGIYGREVFDTWFKMINLIESGLDLEPLITHHFPYQEYQQAFDTMISTNSGKIILDWN